MSASTGSITIGDELRFEFGKNWARFLKTINESCVREAELCLQNSLGTEDLTGKSFLDVGSGSGLFSLAARRLGARVHSFDYDSNSVGCTRTLRERFFSGDQQWTVERGSVLDEDYIRSLGQFDVVYSWGVLHHTGNMYRALDLVALTVTPNGRLLVSIYNDQGVTSARWKALKRAYVRSPRPGKFAILLLTLGITWLRCIPIDILRLKPFRTVSEWRSYSKQRGMSPWHDVVDWAGGYPFEVAKPEDIFEFYRDRGFRLQHLKTCGGGKGCNEFVFLKEREGEGDEHRTRPLEAESASTADHTWA
jgi:2-polyprenyl-3-methyl-5-hydroxy-6-metoxy-1,4-benzoquinol methylase